MRDSSQSSHRRVELRQPVRTDAGRRQRGQHPISERLPKKTGPLPSAGRNKNATPRDHDSPSHAQIATEKEIFHYCQIGEPSSRLKFISPDEESLIAVHKACE